MANRTNNRSDPTRKYLENICRHVLLSAKEEGDLLKKARRGNKHACDKLIRCNLRLVLHVANKHQNRGLEFEDLFQEGVIGLHKAVQRYDLKRLGQVRLATYAVWWIEACIRRAISQTGRMIRLPVNLETAAAKLRYHEQRHAGLTGEPPPTDHAVNTFGFKAATVDRIRSTERLEPISLDEPVNSETSTTFGETLGAAAADLPDQQELYELSELRRSLEHCLRQLTTVETAILLCRYGDDELTLEATAEKLAAQGVMKSQVSRERVRQIESRALDKLRKLLIKAGTVD